MESSSPARKTTSWLLTNTTRLPAESDRHVVSGLWQSQALDLIEDQKTKIEENEVFIRKCNGQTAKILLHLNRKKEAKLLLEDVQDPTVFCDCATILEEKHLLHEAAGMYAKGGENKKAALSYIQLNDLARASDIASTLEDKEVFVALAKAHERQSNFMAALEIYESSGECLPHIGGNY